MNVTQWVRPEISVVQVFEAYSSADEFLVVMNRIVD